MGGLTELTCVDLSGTSMTDTGVTEFKKFLPDVTILWRRDARRGERDTLRVRRDCGDTTEWRSDKIYKKRPPRADE
jgi:hypothetical protein